MIFRRSLTARFLTALFVILIVGQSIGTVILVLNTKAALFESLEKKVKRIANITAGVTAGPLMSYDYSIIDMYLEEVARDEDITSLRIMDAAGKTIRERVIRADNDPGKIINPLLFQGNLSIRVPVMSSGAKIGEIVINYSPRTINQSLTQNIITILLFQIILFLVIGVFMFYLFGRHIRRPVSEINSAVEKITSGDLTIRVPELGSDEMGSIAKGIEFLSERLIRTVSKLNSTAENVAMAIKQVDTTYNNIIYGTKKQSFAIREMIGSVQSANTAQGEISDNSSKLSAISTENVSSLIELKATAEEIASNTHRLFKSTEDSYSVVAQMTHTAKDISKHSSEALTAVEDTSASVEEIAASVREVEDHAKESSKIAEKVKEITASDGMLTVVNAVEGMNNISEQVKKSYEIIERLGARSTDIEKVLSVIKDVTEQTNLLSLNAAILAAQAGEYGKSFSVVADEISALSERTASSTREIGGIVKNIQRDIRDAVNSIDMARTRVDDGNTLVLKVGEALREILNESVHSFEMTKAIERATEEQSLGLGQITTAIDDIRKMMHSIAKSTNEQDVALSYLLEGVGEVKEVADLSKRGMEEQSIGTKVISKNLELANDGITKINQAASNQMRLNENIIRAMEEINRIGETTVKDMEEVSNSLNALYEETNVLKHEMQVFRIT